MVVLLTKRAVHKGEADQVIGVYETKEEAKEALKEIVEEGFYQIEECGNA